MTEVGPEVAEPARWPVVELDLLGPEVTDDFWNVMNEVRERCPVGWNDVAWSPTNRGLWFINDHESVMSAATNWTKFSSAGGSATFQYDLDVFRMIPVETDPPLHRGVRRALNPFFTPAKLAADDNEITKIAQSLMDQCVQRSRFDFMESFAALLPPTILLSLFLGQDVSDGAELLDLVNTMLIHPELGTELVPKLLAWCAKLLEIRRSEGRRDDLAGVIAHLGLSGEEPHLSERQRIETLNLIIMAGMDTTAGAIGSVAWLLATRPELRDELREADDHKLDRAVEEFIRFTAGVPTNARTVTEDTDFRGCPMKSGDRVLLNWAAANLDPAQFTDPMKLDFSRPNVSSHVGFGAGIHRCLGAHLARWELRASIRAICGLRVFEVEAGHEVKFRASMARGPISLPVHADR